MATQKAGPERARETPMPAGLRAAWIRAMHEDAPASYDWSRERDASSSAVRWQVGASGLEASAGEWQVRLSSRRLGREGALEELPEARVEVQGNDARLVRPGIVERWVHGPLGVEHLIELAERAAGEGALAVELAVEGLDARLDGEAVALSDEGGVRARYAELWVEDAAGAAVRSRLEVREGRVHVRVDDRDARYPLVIDPLVATQQAKLLASDGAFYDFFGVSVAVDGDTALIGAHQVNIADRGNVGAAYVFVRSGTTWTQQAKLEASDGLVNESFGYSVALHGDTALVGAYQRDLGFTADAGAAYVFVRSGTTWTEQAKLEASDAGSGDHFGWAVALHGDTALIGAYLDGTDAGSAYVFVRGGTAWSEQAKLRASDVANFDFFGYSVALDGDTALIGAPHDDSSLSDVGSAYVFVRSGTTWSEQAKLVASDAGSSDELGRSVALDGDTALVGVPQGDTSRGADVGSAYVFVRSGTTWAFQAKLEASDGAVDDELGVSVALDGDTALVGAELDDTSRGAGAGSAYVFVRSGTTWTQEAHLGASDGASNDHLGHSVALRGGTALVGAWEEDNARGENAGSAYVFVLERGEGEPCGSGAECASGFCADGVCCAIACAGGASDCQACSVAAGGTADGTCTALSASAAPTVTCRPPAGDCDVAEACAAGSTACPSDAFAAGGTECRASVAICDMAETCTGSSAACPADAFASASTECRAAAADCDAAELCTGASAECPSDAIVAAGIECRAALGYCDVAEACTGSDAACPADAFVTAGTECRTAAGDCDVAESCTGSDAACPADELALAGTECRAASCASGVEMLAASCDGVGASCPSEETRECAPYACASDACGTSCARDGECASGLACEAGACVGVVDGGAPDASIVDAGVHDAALGDGGDVVPTDGGCGCRASSGSRSTWLLGPLFVLAAVLRRRTVRRGGEGR